MTNSAQQYVKARSVKLLLFLPNSSTICGKNGIFMFFLNQLRPKLHSKFCGRNLETRESPNLRKHPITNLASSWGCDQFFRYFFSFDL